MKFEKIIPVIFYRTESGHEPVRVWLKDLAKEDRKTIGEDIRKVQLDFPVGTPLLTNMGTGLWEIRSKLANRISRIFFIIHHGQIFLLHAIIKKTKKTPAGDLHLARQRARNVERGNQ